MSAVRLCAPGDVLVGDGDGVVVVPSWFAERNAWRPSRSMKGLRRVLSSGKIVAESVAPGKYYPPTPEIWRRISRMEEGLVNPTPVLAGASQKPVDNWQVSMIFQYHVSDYIWMTLKTRASVS